MQAAKQATVLSGNASQELQVVGNIGVQALAALAVSLPFT
jgi:hypothetical protein